MAVIRFSDPTRRLIGSAPDSTLSLDMRAYLADCEMRRLSPNTLRIYCTQLAAFHTWAHDKPSEDVTPQDLRIYFLGLKEAGHDAGGQHQAFRVLRTLFGWLVAEGVLQTDPTARLRPPQLREPLDVSIDVELPCGPGCVHSQVRFSPAE
jgi:integrase/recombinase XerD